MLNDHILVHRQVTNALLNAWLTIIFYLIFWWQGEFTIYLHKKICNFEWNSVWFHWPLVWIQPDKLMVNILFTMHSCLVFLWNNFLWYYGWRVTLLFTTYGLRFLLGQTIPFTFMLHIKDWYIIMLINITCLLFLMQKNKRDFFMFLVLEVLAMLITGAISLASMCLIVYWIQTSFNYFL